MTSSAITRITNHDDLPTPTPAPRTIPGQAVWASDSPDEEQFTDDLADALTALATTTSAVTDLEGSVARSRAWRRVWEQTPDDDRIAAAEATAALLGMRIVNSGEYWRADRAGVATASLVVKDGHRANVAVLMVADQNTQDGDL